MLVLLTKHTLAFSPVLALTCSDVLAACMYYLPEWTHPCYLPIQAVNCKRATTTGRNAKFLYTVLTQMVKHDLMRSLTLDLQ